MPEHGSYARYIAEQKSGEAHCRACVEAELEYQRKRRRAKAYGRPLKVEAFGTVRRLQALMALGWPQGYLAAQVNRSASNLATRADRYPTVRAGFAQRVDELYQQLRWTCGPSERTVRHSQKVGYAPPECWPGDSIDDATAEPVWPDLGPDIDEVAMERFLAGDDRVELNRDEKAAAFARMVAEGVAPSRAGYRLKMSGATSRKVAERLSA